jgi:outer membrane lipoprotein-sorting protein
MAHAIAKHDYVFRKLSAIAQCCKSALGCDLFRVVCAYVICVWVILAGSTTNADEVKRAEVWFNKIKSIKLLFRRPSQMKITYQKHDGGKGLQLITSKVWLHVDRPDEKLLTSYPLSETPLSLILAAKVSLRPDGYETRIKPSSAGVVQILVSKEHGAGAGQLTLEFSENPFQFRRWIVVDGAGIETSVTLFNLVLDTPIPNVSFKLPSYSAEN